MNVHHSYGQRPVTSVIDSLQNISSKRLQEASMLGAVRRRRLRQSVTPCRFQRRRLYLTTSGEPVPLLQGLPVLLRSVGKRR